MTLAGASMLAKAAAAAPAQPVNREPAVAQASLGEIVVTARRKSESLQEASQVVNAIAVDTLAKLQNRDFRDIQTVSPDVSRYAFGSR